MTTDNFHGIDRLVGHSKYHPVPVRNAINPSPESDWLGRGPGRFVEFEWPVINAGDSVISKDDSRDTAIITIVQDEPEFIHPWINHYKSTSLMHNIQSHNPAGEQDRASHARPGVALRSIGKRFTAIDMACYN
jgi:hypothetical protein